MSRRMPVSVQSFLVGTCLALGSSLSVAATYPCVGTVTNVVTSPQADVTASFTFDTGSMTYQAVCNLETPSGTISVAACKSILATLLAAKLSERPVTLWFNNSSGNSCSLAPWGSLTAFGWYWGPAIS